MDKISVNLLYVPLPFHAISSSLHKLLLDVNKCTKRDVKGTEMVLFIYLHLITFYVNETESVWNGN